MSVAGTVTQLHRWPVKSMGGEPVDTLAVDGRGAAGDRAHAVFDVHKGAPRRLTARQAPRLLAWRASYDGDLADPALRAPDGTEWAWSDPGLPAALSADLGRDVTLHSDPALQQDLPDSLLVTVQSTLDAVAAELGAELDLRRFRTNIHVELDADAFAEEGWEGRTLRVGSAELALLHPCERCAIPTRHPDTQEKWAPLLRHLFDRHTGRFGINARARGSGAIAIGDRVTLD
ncbi:MAG TPA: MOSC N-terminal beta barrel domain-containing protein [Thermoleophilaceae bacterium]|nr:MOSC N-terminal beta barrel domain-containing protein [Thermoleophilaceae bacterium]